MLFGPEYTPLVGRACSVLQFFGLDLVVLFVCENLVGFCLVLVLVFFLRSLLSFSA